MNKNLCFVFKLAGMLVWFWLAGVNVAYCDDSADEKAAFDQHYRQDKSTDGAGSRWIEAQKQQAQTLKNNARTPQEYNYYQTEESKAKYFQQKMDEAKDRNEKKKGWW